jgi:hypothetical protein
MPILSTFASLLCIPVASAGGVGLLATGGLHEERAYYYRDDGIQGIDLQRRPTKGFGGEAVLGDKDDKVQGMARLYYIQDTPAEDPDLSGEDTDSYQFTFPPASEQDPQEIGVLSLGLQWNVWGDPTGFQAVVTSFMGSGFATVDNLEFLLAEVGVGATYTVQDRFQVYVNGAGTTRFRKSFYMGTNAYVGFRYLFD